MAINIKHYLADALIELSLERPLSKTTVRDITSKIGAGRQTFYNHFKDKNDLIYYIFLQTLAGERDILETSGFYAYLVALYAKAQKNSHFFKEAVKLTGQNSLAEAIYNQTYKYYKRCIQRYSGQTEIDDQMEYALQFNACGASNLYIKWAEAGMPGSATEQASYALHCIPECIKQYLPLADKGNDELSVWPIDVLQKPS